MKTADRKDTSVGKIVAENFAAAKVFKKYGIDFCCHGETQLHEACAALKLDVEEVIQALQHQDSDGRSYSLCIVVLDLLMDYILKIHHRGIRSRGPELMELLEKVERVHGEAYPELHELRALVSESLQDLEMHLQKEENVLFLICMNCMQHSSKGNAWNRCIAGPLPIRFG